jgi:hypothetical protein
MTNKDLHLESILQRLLVGVLEQVDSASVLRADNFIYIFISIQTIDFNPNTMYTFVIYLCPSSWNSCFDVHFYLRP